MFLLVGLFAQISFAGDTSFVRTDLDLIIAIQKTHNSEKTYTVNYTNQHICDKIPHSCSEFLGTKSLPNGNRGFWKFNLIDSGKSEPFVNPNLDRQESYTYQICFPRPTEIFSMDKSAKIERLTCNFSLSSPTDLSSLKVAKESNYTINWTRNPDLSNEENGKIFQMIQNDFCDLVIDERECI